MLGSSISNYNARQAIDSGAIILVRLNGKNDIDQLMASLVVWDLKAAVMSRTDTPPDQRREIHAWFDEVQDYDGAIRGQISDILEQTRKFGMRLHLLNQQPSSLQKKTLSATLTNRSHLFATAVNAESARMLASNMSPTMSPAVIQDTPKYNFVSQVTIKGELSSPFRCRGIGLEEAFGAMPPASVAATVQQEIDANSGRRSIDETLAAQERLDERILEHLGATSGNASCDRGGDRAGPAHRGGSTMQMKSPGLTLVTPVGKHADQQSQLLGQGWLWGSGRHRFWSAKVLREGVEGLQEVEPSVVGLEARYMAMASEARVALLVEQWEQNHDLRRGARPAVP